MKTRRAVNKVRNLSRDFRTVSIPVPKNKKDNYYGLILKAFKNLIIGASLLCPTVGTFTITFCQWYRPLVMRVKTPLVSLYDLFIIIIIIITIIIIIIIVVPVI